MFLICAETWNNRYTAIVDKQIYSSYFPHPFFASHYIRDEGKKSADAVNHRLKINQHNTNAVLNALR